MFPSSLFFYLFLFYNIFAKKSIVWVEFITSNVKLFGFFVFYEKADILSHVQELTSYLEEQLDKRVVEYPVVAARRGKGFMQGLVIKGTTVGSVVTKALANGLLVISAGSDVLRLVPPLVITKEHINEMIEKLEKSLA